jgi:hypothetical protein
MFYNYYLPRVKMKNIIFSLSTNMLKQVSRFFSVSENTVKWLGGQNTPEE